MSLAEFSTPALQPTVEEMRELFSQSNLAFLLGAGCSKIAKLPLMDGLTDQVKTHNGLSDQTKYLLNTMENNFAGGKACTIEDFLSELIDYYSITSRRQFRGATATSLKIGTRDFSPNDLEDALKELKGAISIIIGDIDVDSTTHQQFVKAVHFSLQAGKAPRSVDYFILNYDTLIEDALGLEGVDYCDGFAGGATGWWKPDSFRTAKKPSRVFKVHGSIDWCLLDKDPLPRRIRKGVNTASLKRHVLIYPAATKYQESQRDPFATMLGNMRQSLCPSEGKEMVLAICGYGFGDSHIDLEIENALHQSEGRLTVVAFVGTDIPEGTLKRWLDDSAISEQVRVYANRGFFHGSNSFKHDADLSWWKFEILTRLLGGER